MLDFPIVALMDNDLCHRWLMTHMHPDGLVCPKGHPLRAGQGAHSRDRAPILDYRCEKCGAVFNMYTGTMFQKTYLTQPQLVLLLRGIVQGTPTAHLAREVGIGRKNLGIRRRKIQALVQERFSPLDAARLDRGSRRDVPECR